ncbi:hypothetical protein M413DRAFT_242165 [Hebeloma cylindrosporum]|uniref:Protein kinase domain-containing protein n=1 Tax=Hebeloma cylindrosporum TaxID=76867 RepID=A0A0C3C2G0_HEBCY|nr:hypothetical protein M413DRAFT_242165 [Hebeloma cylindrosporum h7]
MSIFRLGKKIGSGGFSHVFEGTNTGTGAVCAIKKSRASLRLKRTLLKHEARILKRLEGHPAIPEVYGYGRVEHFELLAIELLGNSLADEEDEFVREFSIQEVASIGAQMLSALEHIHSHGIAHRDIKPQNILSRNGTDVSHLCLIDFGLARRRLTGIPRQVDLVKERTNVVGTLSWASLNAYNGIDLNPRDDLESLAFVLLYLLRGNLPWHKLCDAGTALARIPQIRSKMLSWDGARLAEGYPSVFGELLDYARQLDFDEPIDYERFRAAFEKLRHAKVERNVRPDAIPITAKECLAGPGDLVLVQINPQTSVEGYTLRDDNSSYWADPSLSGDSWKCLFRPAVILSTKGTEEGRYSFLIIPLTKLRPVDALSLKEIGVAGLPESLSNLSAYVFPRALEIRCLPTQTPLHSQWKVSPAALELLREKFDKRLPVFNYSKTEDSNPDVRHETRLRMQGSVFYAKFLPLDSSPDTEIDWTGVRGWFDECVRVGRRRGWDDGFFWTGHPVEERTTPRLDDSYYGDDATSWDFRQQERDEELEIDGEDDVDLPVIEQVVQG